MAESNADAASHLRAQDSMALVSFVILVYEHILTFGDEVEYVWKKKITPLTILFLTNRYFALPAFAVSMSAVFFPGWTIDACRSVAQFEGATTQICVLIAEVMLIHRVYAVNTKKKLVLGILVPVWLLQFSLQSDALSHTQPVVFPPSNAIFGCILVAKPDFPNFIYFFLVPTVIFDALAFTLLIYGLHERVRRGSQSTIFRLVLRDGIVYFGILFAMNMTWTFTSRFLVDDLKNIFGFFNTVITIILMSRLTLHVKMYQPKAIYWGTSVTDKSRTWPRRVWDFMVTVDETEDEATTVANTRTTQNFPMRAMNK